MNEQSTSQQFVTLTLIRFADKGIIDFSTIFFVTDNDRNLHFQSRFMARLMFGYNAIFTGNKMLVDDLSLLAMVAQSFCATSSNINPLKGTRILP